ncbi:MAG: helix-turn-helix transcriptional regulator [Bacillota bacterium]|jgi:predicted transcriptional regulator|nr:helix-turn-helix transcriptional regulator [Bacillota bacterium]
MTKKQISNKKRIVCRRLRGLMVEHQLTTKDLSKKLGISESSLMKKINGHSDWWYKEVVFIIQELGFSEVQDVFPEIVKAYSSAS